MTYYAKRREIMNALKSGPCADCGIQYPPYAMDFDHVRGEKTIHVGSSKMFHSPLDRVIEEIEKCDLVCSNCHRIRTHNRKHKEAE